MTGETLAVFTPACNEPPAADAAIIDLAATTLREVLTFADAAAQVAIFTGVMPNTYTAGAALSFRWGFTTTTAGTGINYVTWQVAFERSTTGQDVQTDGFAAAQAVNATAPTNAHDQAYATVAFTSAQADGILPGEAFRVKVTRDGTNDTFDGIAWGTSAEIREA